jgi:hypothetical protein
VRALLVCEDPLAVVPFLVYPAGFIERLRRECCEHGSCAEWNAGIYVQLFWGYARERSF